MPWFKVDDTLHSHPKARRAGMGALGLWGICGSYCMAYKTDGFVPEWFVATFPSGKKFAADLVTAGLWQATKKNDESGWQYHDWDDYQPSSDEIERDRERSRDRQRKRRAKLRGEQFVTAVVTWLLTGGVTRDVHRESRPPVPTRPDPSRPMSVVASVCHVAGYQIQTSTRWAPAFGIGGPTK